MKVALYGKNSNSIAHLLGQYGLEISDDKPDVIISYGGDGTLLSAERKFPSIPKLPIRDSKVCKKCPEHSTEHLLESLADGSLKSESFPKLEAKIGDEDVLAINDIVIRNSTPMHAIRFKVFKNSHAVTPEIIIGDGVVATTPFGSTGYFQSITRETLEKGFALAFNNTVQEIPLLKFDGDDIVKIVVVRGPGSFSSDNNPKQIPLHDHDEIKFFPSRHLANIYALSGLRCGKCVILRDRRLDH